MLEVCEDNHPEICFIKNRSWDKCPICELLKEKDEQINILEEERNKLDSDISDLQGEIQDLKATQPKETKQ